VNKRRQDDLGNPRLAENRYALSVREAHLLGPASSEPYRYPTNGVRGANEGRVLDRLQVMLFNPFWRLPFFPIHEDEPIYLTRR